MYAVPTVIGLVGDLVGFTLSLDGPVAQAVLAVFAVWLPWALVAEGVALVWVAFVRLAARLLAAAPGSERAASRA